MTWKTLLFGGAVCNDCKHVRPDPPFGLYSLRACTRKQQRDHVTGKYRFVACSQGNLMGHCVDFAPNCTAETIP